ncbi:rhamnulokinase [Glaciibacter flavus]|uniref:rhamnulokinase n=1 Tax=Orlajensenia flava TaxID=2565934 RepID=UPI003B00BEFA
MSVHIAVDLGATSGRVSYGSLSSGRLNLVEVARFANEPLHENGRMVWNLSELYGQSIDGIRAAIAHAKQQGLPDVTSIGVDSWGVDYSLLRTADGDALASSHYRSASRSSHETLKQLISVNVAYSRTGILSAPINSINRLSDLFRRDAQVNGRSILLIPDLWVFWLCGVVGAERTIASTTELLDAVTGDWSTDQLAEAGIPAESLPAVVETGSIAGRLTPRAVAQLEAHPSVVVVRVAEHDTASAVLALPLHPTRPEFAYVSCGSWSLVGQELAAPILTAEALSAGFTNEQGAFGSTLFMRNLTGLWLLEECVREWNADRSEPLAVVDVIAEARAAAPFDALIDVSHPDFVEPGQTSRLIASHCRNNGYATPSTPGEFARCILESLALAYRLAIDAAEGLSGSVSAVVHLTGGGSRNELLCQLTADACERVVLAGPAEGSSAGNVLVQMISARTVRDTHHARELVREAFPPKEYIPAPDARERWASAISWANGGFASRTDSRA